MPIVTNNITVSAVGASVLNTTDPSSVSWIRVNADNTITYRSAAQTLSDLGAQAAGTYLVPADIGVTVQGYNANTTILGNSTTGSGSIVLATSPTIATSLILDYGTASTVVYLNASKQLISLANGSGVLTNDGSGGLSWAAVSGGAALSAITAATGTNTINNVNFAQVWAWNSLTTEIGHTFSSSSVSTGSIVKVISTSTVGNASKGLEIAISGANSTSAKTNYGIYSAVTNTGTTSTNIAGYFSATGGTTNQAIRAYGRVQIGDGSTDAPSGTNNLSIDGGLVMLCDAGGAGRGRFQIFDTAGTYIDMQAINEDIRLWGNSVTLRYSKGGVATQGLNVAITTGNVTIGAGAATARLHITSAGTTAAGTAPLKLTAGTNMTTPENGAIEFDGTNIYITVGGVRKTFTIV